MSIVFSRFWNDAKIAKPLLVFLFFYFGWMYVFLLVLPNCPKDDEKAYKDGEWIGDYKDCKTAGFTQQIFKRETKQVAVAHKSYVKVITFVLGFYVATMMRRWWSQISKLPDITQVAMALNGFVQPNPDDSVEMIRASNLKKDILRYCMLSYSLLMIELTRPSTTPKTWIAKVYVSLTKFYKRDQETRKAQIVDLDYVQGKNLLLPHEAAFFKDKDMDKFWWLPLHWACKKIQANRGMIDSSYEVVNALKEFQHNLYCLLEYHMNPFPNICSHAVYVAAWVYLLLATYASQMVDKMERYDARAWITSFFAVSFQDSKGIRTIFKTCILSSFQNIPWIPSAIIAVLFSMLQMAEICKSPFHQNSEYDVQVKEEIDIQSYLASLALYHDTPLEESELHFVFLKRKVDTFRI